MSCIILCPPSHSLNLCQLLFAWPLLIANISPGFNSSCGNRSSAGFARGVDLVAGNSPPPPSRRSRRKSGPRATPMKLVPCVWTILSSRIKSECFLAHMVRMYGFVDKRLTFVIGLQNVPFEIFWGRNEDYFKNEINSVARKSYWGSKFPKSKFFMSSQSNSLPS